MGQCRAGRGRIGKGEAMGRKDQSSVERYHDRVAHRYDDIYDDAYWQWHDALTWDYLKPFLPRNQSARVVDLGCGTGKWAQRAVDAGLHVTCVDISRAMVDRARDRFERLGRLERTSFVHADLARMPELDDGTFSLAMALGDPIGCTDSPARALKEIRRILVPDGILVATFDNRLSAIDFFLERGDRDGLERFLTHGRTHWLTRDAAEQFEIHTYGPRELRSLLEHAGFEILSLVGKTVLPMRRFRDALENPESRRAWAKIEKRLSRDPAALGRASHLQVACRPVSG